jgi:tetratricopeptide (TPR) repeat protein
LTPGALARVYVREGLYAQAIQELNALVAESSARFDARVTLAETLWRVGQMRQAAEIAQALLEALPYCLKANLILGVVWKETGLSESEQYLQRAQSLDPTNQIAQRLFGANSPLPVTQARVPRYVEGAPSTPLPMTEESPAVETEGAEDRLQAPEEPLAQTEMFGVPAFKPPIVDTALPPWLRTLPSEAVEEQAAPPQAAAPIPQTPVEAAPKIERTEVFRPEPEAQPSSGLPAWVKEADASRFESVTQTPDEFPPSFKAPVPHPKSATQTPGGFPAWLKDVETPVSESAPPASGESPSWLAQLQQSTASSAEPTTETPVSKPVPPPSGESPSWLAQLQQSTASSAEPTTETPVSEPVPPPSGESPSWLAQLQQSTASSAEPTTQVPVAPSTDTSSGLPPWLRSEAKTEEAAPTIPSWIQEAQSAEEKMVPPAPKAEPLPEAAPDLPPWIATESRGKESASTHPTWIEEAQTAEAKEGFAPAPRSTVPPWVAVLSHTEEHTPKPAEPQPDEQGLPPWMSQPARPIATTPVEEPFPTPLESKPREEELPPWLTQPARLPKPPPPSPVAPMEPSAPARKRKSPMRGDSHLVLARTYRDANQLRQALEEYDYIVQKAPRLINQVIGDLEALLKRSDVPLDIHRILGDAYTRADRLSEALEEYRFVLGHVSS